MKSLADFVLQNKFFVTAHRGSSGTAPENTLAAFNQAVEAGAKMIETDVQFSLDGRVVCLHDETLDRTSDGSGLCSAIPYEEIKKLDAGKWFAPEFAGERVPPLTELISAIRDKAYLNIEIKSGESSRTEEEIKKIIGIIAGADYEKQTLFSSFDYKLLVMIKKINPALHTAAIMLPGDARLPSKICKEIQAEAFVCSLHEINAAIADDAEKHGLYLGVYSFDDPKQLEIAFKYNIKAIVTNYPDRIIEEIKRIMME